ncbi:polysaccharide biosynthesis protein [Haliangium ochraceum DSM 14365]|uniref:Polysaccharide biosynthesis protein n=2 Tax=Haliangium ochraceum TaxID=80816 RepID=D0LZ76_HALO1|nr:polysaccharide biosynthesis protein [Haliangium ochraceum DSM 14365]
MPSTGVRECINSPRLSLVTGSSMSLARKAVHGAMWTVGASLGARAIGLVGTVVITYFLSPTVVAEVNAAAILAMSASLLSNFGIGNYYIVKGDDREVAFHMTVYNLLLGAVVFGLVLAFNEPLSELLNLPAISEFVPGMVLAWSIRRVAMQSQKVLVRDMRFGRLSIARALGEISFVLTSVGLAALEYGGMAIVIGNIVQYSVDGVITITSVHWRTWLEPCKLRWERTVDMFRFGWPLGVNAFVGYATHSWDRLLFANLFNTHLMGLYNYAYRLAEIPASQVGDQISDVLLPSMSKLDAEGRKRALIRSTALLGVLLFPLTVGLAAVAEPLITLIFDEAWHSTAPMVSVLGACFVFEPIGSTLVSYLMAQSRTRTLMILQIIKLGALFAGMTLLSTLGPLWACGGVGVGFAVYGLVSAYLCVRRDNIPAGKLLSAFVQPLTACVPMVGAVLGVRYGLRAAGFDSPALSLGCEIVAGAAVYVPAVFLTAPATARDFLSLVRKALKRGG